MAKKSRSRSRSPTRCGGGRKIYIRKEGPNAGMKYVIRRAPSGKARRVYCAAKK